MHGWSGVSRAYFPNMGGDTSIVISLTAITPGILNKIMCDAPQKKSQWIHFLQIGAFHQTKQHW